MEIIKWTAAKTNPRSSTMEKFSATVEGFEVTLSWSYDESFDFDHYGVFCEDRSIGRNDFALRNPNCWRKRDLGNGTDSWERTSTREYGWFKLANHPKHEVEWYMKNENMPEREAWQKVLDRERETVRKLIHNELFAIVVKVEVCLDGIELGNSMIGGCEIEDWVKDTDVFGFESDHGLVKEALMQAKVKLKKLATKFAEKVTNGTQD